MFLYIPQTDKAYLLSTICAKIWMWYALNNFYTLFVNNFCKEVHMSESW